MTRGVSAQAVHERLEHLAAGMPQPDLDAGWAALAAQLEPPVAPVIALRRRRHRRTVVLGVAAAMLAASGAFAMVRHGGDEAQGSPARSGATAPPFLRVGPHSHRPFVGPPAADDGTPPSHPSTGQHDGKTTPTGGQPSSSSDSPRDTSAGSTQHEDTHPFHHDAADDTDHGTGNDGTHDDNGQGNDAGGQDSQGQDSQGDGGSGGGSGNDQGSAGGQASGRATHPGDNGLGSGAAGQRHAQGGGHGPNA
jgi:hypothetical protein